VSGLAGIFQYRTEALPVNQAELLRIRESMVFRGPDGAGLWLAHDLGIGLAHRRSIEQRNITVSPVS
jgi:asparagine synthase (glutamine-hydrolysing)